MAGFTVENMDFNAESVDTMNTWPESLASRRAVEELGEAIQAIKAHEDAKRTVESTGKLAKKEMEEAGVPLDPKDRWGLEISDTPDPLSREALQNRLVWNIFAVASKDSAFNNQVGPYVFTSAERVKMLNKAPESAKQIKSETGTNAA